MMRNKNHQATLSLLSFLLMNLCILNGKTSFGQSMYGTVLGNYSGVNSPQLNPSALHNSRMYLDIQLTGLDIFAENNYLYLSKYDYRFGNFFNPGFDWPTHEEPYALDKRVPYFYNNQRLKSAYVQTRVNGPGAMLIIGKHAFALTTSVRSQANLKNIPYELANFSWIGLTYTPQHDINYIDRIPIRGNGAAWAEIGLSYANTILAREYDMLSVGVSVKRLMSPGGGYVHTRELNYVIPDSNTIDVRNMEAQMAMAIPVNYETNGVNTDKIFKGHGFGFDLGFTYKRLLRYHQHHYLSTLCAQPYEDYLYRIGIALIDIGAIRFNNNALKMNIDNRSSYWENISTLQFRDLDNFLDTLSYQFYGDTVSLYTGNKFTMWLPAALSAQFDYHFKRDLFINASLIYSVPFARGSMTRPAELTITPRYETAVFEVNMPVSLYNWTRPRVGLSVRFYGLTIGTEKLGGFFHFTDFTGLDFYFSLKLFFNKGNCRDKGPQYCGEKPTEPVRKR